MENAKKIFDKIKEAEDQLALSKSEKDIAFQDGYRQGLKTALVILGGK